MEEVNQVQYKNKSSNRGVLIGIAIIVAVIVGYVFFIVPLTKQVAISQGAFDEKKLMVSAIDAQIDDINEAKASLGDSSEVERSNILKMIPVGPNQDDVIRAITKEAEKHDVIMNSLSFSNVASKKAGVGIMKANASFESAYVDLAGFLRDLETSSRLMKVDSLNVQVSKLALAGERVNFSLTIESYYQK